MEDGKVLLSCATSETLNPKTDGFTRRFLISSYKTFCAGKRKKQTLKRARVFDSSEESEEEEPGPSSNSDVSGDEESSPLPQCEETPRYKIPKHPKIPNWSSEDLENFRKIWPHLKNFSDAILKRTSMRDMALIGRQKLSNGKILSQTMTANFEAVQNFPDQVQAGPDDCLGIVHKARFHRGYVGDAQEIWLQAREDWGPDGIDPIANYEVVSIGLGDLLTHNVWAKIHKPNARDLSITMLSQGSVEEAWKNPDKSESPKEFGTLAELKQAVASLEAAMHKVMPWNFAFTAVQLFLISIDFGDSELSGHKAKLQFLSNFIDEALRANARNWEEKKKFLSNQELCARWSANLTRKGVSPKGGGGLPRGKPRGPTSPNRKSPDGFAGVSMRGLASTKTTSTLLIGIRGTS